MTKLRFKLHPLFILFGIYFAFTGKVFSFIIYTLTAVIHELGHFYSSEKKGYALKKIVLMPYGALIEGNVGELKYSDECKIALAGPLINGIIAVVFIAIWWVFPITYPFTEEIVIANLSLALINLLPCYPLDGGRFLLATLSLKTSRKKAKIIVKTLGVTFSLLLLALFIYSIFEKLNLTLLFFASFIFVGAVFEQKDGEYVKIFSSLTFKKVTFPREVRRVVVGGDSLVKSLYPFLMDGFYYEIEIILDDGEVILKGENLNRFLYSQNGYEKLNSALKKFTS
ncbi:MAG: site-2 protease family protein [Clostridia bacterium]|nr:site-2 protease family protein [Clostridia bacterium]